jgi:hypothetical protein
MQVTQSTKFAASNLASGSRRRMPIRLCTSHRMPLVAFALAMVVQLMWPAGLAAQNCSPYSGFQSLTDAQLATLQVKLTYVGVSNGLVSSLVFNAPGDTLDLTLFDLCAQEGFSDPSPSTLAIGIAELRAILNNVGTLPNVTGGGVAPDPFVAFSLANSQPTKKTFEAILNSTTAADLFAQLRKSLSNDKAATVALSRLGCSLGLNEPGAPTNITAVFGVTLSGLRLNRSTHTLVGTMTVTNNSNSTPPAPVSVVFDLPINVTVANPDGITCLTDLPGRGFINLNSIPLPGQKVSMPVEFKNLDQEPLTLKTRVFAGPGAR